MKTTRLPAEVALYVLKAGKQILIAVALVCAMAFIEKRFILRERERDRSDVAPIA